MDYVEAKDAKSLEGLRLALVRGVPSPWSEAAKVFFRIKNIPFVPVAQHPGEANEDLVAWTGSRNAPVAVWNQEAPRAGWLDILMLAERLGPTPQLLPDDLEQRSLAIGISHELCGEAGLGWCRRVEMLPEPEIPTDALPHQLVAMRDAYGTWDFSKPEAATRCVRILNFLAERISRQQQAGPTYLVGDSLTCADIYWACFSQLLRPLPQNVNPMSEFVRTLYSTMPPAIEAALDPILFTHRDFIFEKHIPLPLDY